MTTFCASFLFVLFVVVLPAEAKWGLPSLDTFANANGPLFVAQLKGDDVGGRASGLVDPPSERKRRVKDHLTGEQVRKLVSGKTTEWDDIVLHGEEETPEHRRPHGRTYFSPDGRTEGTINGRVRFGKWWVDGDHIFIKWDKARDTFRAVLQPDGKGGHYRVRLRDGQKRSHWKTWFEGKQL